MNKVRKVLSKSLQYLGVQDLAIRHVIYNPLAMKTLSWANRLRWRQIDLTLILWPPALHLFDEIRKDIGERYDIHSYEIVDMRADVFEEFIKKLYAIDFANPRKIALKLERLQRPPHRLGVMEIRIPKPKMIVQDALNRVRCETVGDLKDEIRRKYKNQVPDYIYDIIIHSTETDYQTPMVRALLDRYGSTVVTERD